MHAKTAFGFALIAAHALPGQCTNDWLPGQGTVGCNDALFATTMWDRDGSGPEGPRLVVAGNTMVIGSVICNGIAERDPLTGSWSEMRTGLNGGASALLGLSNGNLIVGGTFSTADGAPASRIARWSGATWAPLGAGLADKVESLAQLQSGDIVAGGWFTGGVARWNGSSWSLLGGGVANASGLARVLALKTLPNGDLVAGGVFTSAGGVPCVGIALWNGTTWSALPGFGVGECYSLGRLPNGHVVAGGYFTIGGVAHAVVEWTGSAWSPVGTLNTLLPRALQVLGNGDVVVGGQALTGFAVTIVRWNGATWSSLGSGVSFASGPPPGGGSAAVLGLAEHTNGDLWVAGYFTHADNVVTNHLARWDGAAWAADGNGTDDSVAVLAVKTNGDVVAGGGFTAIEGTPAAHIARWRAGAWSPLGTGTDGAVSAVIEMPSGNLVVGGLFTTAGGVPASNIAQWNGSTWSPLGGGTNGVVRALTLLPNGDLIAGGSFSTAGSAPAASIARWDGVAWAPLGSGVNVAGVHVLRTLVNGDVLVGGNFSTAGGLVCNSIARWDGLAWSPLGQGVTQSVFGIQFTALVTSLLVRPSGELVIGGRITQSGSTPINNVARWNGAAWGPMQSGLGPVTSLTLLPDGDVLASGTFSNVAGIAATNLARWNGSNWSSLTGPAAATVALQANGEFMLGGSFLVAGLGVSAYLARMQSTCPASATLYGAACSGSAGPVALTATSGPWLGGTFRARTTGIPNVALALSVFGLGQVSLSLPTLLPQGVPGCSLLASPDTWSVHIPANGAVATQLVIPDAIPLIGASVYHQVVPLELDTSVAIVAVTASNGLALTIGVF